MKKIRLIAIALAVVMTVVCITQPLYIKANENNLTYQETNMTTTEVVQLYSGAELWIPVAITIIGLIAMTYCVLRNIDVPIQFNNQQSFIDKCSELGQYVIDNATDDIKNVLYSVYDYAETNNLTSITGISAFIAMNAAQFFTAISKWIGSSLITNVSTIGQGLVNELGSGKLILNMNTYSYLSDFKSVFAAYSGVIYANTFGAFNGNYWGHSSSGSYYDFFTIKDISAANYIIVNPYTNHSMSIGFYQYDNITEIFTNKYVTLNSGRFQYATSNRGNVQPNLSTYSTVNLGTTNIWEMQIGLWGSGDTTYHYFDTEQIYNFINFIKALGLGVAVINTPVHGLATTYNNSAVTILQPAQVTVTSDVIAIPTADQWVIDLVGTWEQILEGINTQTEKIQAFVGDIDLTISSALTDVNKYTPSGTYNIPALDNIWKYVEYMWNTLGSWFGFVGNCVQAVTVGNGGISWLFYGAFIVLVCGGIIGKMLL